MEKVKYEHLVKPLSAGGMDVPAMKEMKAPKGAFANGPGNADKIVWLNGRDHLEGLDLNFTWGFYSGIGDWHTGQDPHTHPYPECLVFVGLNPANLDYLGAEIEMCLGEEQEAYTFDVPTVVIVPAGMPHCPLTTRRVWSPKGFGFYLASLGSIPTTTWMGEEVSEETMRAMQAAAAKSGRKIAMTSYVAAKRLKKNPTKPTGKYAHLIKPLKTGAVIQRGKILLERLTPERKERFDETAIKGQKPGPGYADHLARFSGKDLEGLNVSLTWGFHSKPGIWYRGVGAHVHPTDEVLVFAGLDPADINYLGAKIEIEMGSEHERHTFDKPTAVICPKGLPHNPIVVRWVDRPYAVYTISLGAEHKTAAVD